MTKTALFIGFFLLISPAIAMAATPSCSAQGYTVVFVNGIFDTETEAHQNNDALKQKFGSFYNGQPVTFQLGYNPSHLAGAGDLVQSFAQQFNTSLSDFDLNTILMQIYPEVTTRKLLIVGHSQGAQYANQMYSYLLAHGEPREAVGVYAVGTPASFVAGGGKYITFDTDKVINAVAAAAGSANALGAHIPMPLPSNAYLALTSADQASAIGGHAFIDDYLEQAAPQILADTSAEMNALQATDASQTGDCFTPPDASLGYKTQQALFAIGDPTATVLKVGLTTTVQASEVALNTASKVAVGALQFFADTVAVTAQPPSPSQTDADTLKIVNKLYGSSLDGLSAQDKKDLLGTSQGGAVALAAAPKKPAVPGIVLGTSTEATSTPPVINKNIFPASSNGPIVGGGGGGPVSGVADAEVAQNAVSVTPDPALADPPADTAATSSDETATTTPDIATTTPDIPQAPPAVSASIIAAQEDSSGTPVHYWNSDGTTGSYLSIDPNDNQPGFSIGTLSAVDTSVVGIHIKVQFNTDGTLAALPKIPYLYDESNLHVFACQQQPFRGVAYGNANDALLGQNPLAASDYDNKMVDMYFTCATGNRDTLSANTSYRLFFYSISTASVFDIYVAANPAGVPFYEISADGTY